MKNKLITAGVDEVGRGCLAGPVVSAAVILKEGINLDLLKDSKKISFNKRERISEHIKYNSYYSIGIASVSYSIWAIITGSIIPSGTLMSTGAPIEICNALAPIILALSNRVWRRIGFTIIITSTLSRNRP